MDGKESGYVIGRMTFAKREGKVNFDDCYYTDESYPDEDDFVVDEEGHLAGFLVEENIVLWISDFERGGRCYGSNGEYGDFGLVLQEYTETDFEDKEIWLAEFGYLTHSRW